MAVIMVRIMFQGINPTLIIIFNVKIVLSSDSVGHGNQIRLS